MPYQLSNKMPLLKHRYFPVNENGHDYFGGDVHGAWQKVQSKLDQVGFDPNVDRLFLTGDLGDKGPHCRGIYDWVSNKSSYVFSVLGNHDKNILDYGEDPESNWAQKWGGWYTCLNPVFRRQIADAIRQYMPIAMTIQTAIGPVGVVHAGTPYDSWFETLGVIANSTKNEHLRPFIFERSYYESDFGKQNGMYDIQALFSGHCPTKSNDIERSGDRFFLDTDAYRDGHEYKLYCTDTQRIY